MRYLSNLNRGTDSTEAMCLHRTAGILTILHNEALDKRWVSPLHSERCLTCTYCTKLRAKAPKALTTRLADGGNDNLLWEWMSLIIALGWMGPRLYTRAIKSLHVKLHFLVKWGSPQQGKAGVFLSWRTVTIYQLPAMAIWFQVIRGAHSSLASTDCKVESKVTKSMRVWQSLRATEWEAMALLVKNTLVTCSDYIPFLGVCHNYLCPSLFPILRINTMGKKKNRTLNQSL